MELVSRFSQDTMHLYDQSCQDFHYRHPIPQSVRHFSIGEQRSRFLKGYYRQYVREISQRHERRWFSVQAMMFRKRLFLF